MGIKGLPIILAKFKLIKNYEHEKDSKYKKTQFTYHIDLFILLFKFIHTSKSWETYNTRLLQYFKYFTRKNTNKLIVYSDFCENKRKALLRGIRKKDAIKQQNILKAKIKESDIKDYNYDIENLLKIEKINTAETFNKFILNCNPEQFCRKKRYYNVPLNNSENYLEQDISKHLDTFVDLDDKNEELCKQCFRLAMRKIDFNLLLKSINEIFEELKERYPYFQIVKRECYSRDAEIDIIKNIKKYKYPNNFIISTDNDVKAFALLHLKKKLIISDLAPTLNSKCYILKCDEKCAKNIIRLILLTHETDYFPGIKDISFCQRTIVACSENEKICSRLIEKLELDELLEYWIKFLETLPRVTYPELTLERTNEIKAYLDDFKIYLSLSREFYQKEQVIIDQIHRNELISYFKDQQNQKDQKSKNNIIYC